MKERFRLAVELMLHKFKVGKEPVNMATEAEVEKILCILGPHLHERFGMKPVTLADLGKDTPRPQFSKYYSEPIKIPTRWELIRGWLVGLAIRWVCRK